MQLGGSAQRLAAALMAGTLEGPIRAAEMKLRVPSQKIEMLLAPCHDVLEARNA
jgi:hypothetical protein